MLNLKTRKLMNQLGPQALIDDHIAFNAMMFMSLLCGGDWDIAWDVYYDAVSSYDKADWARFDSAIKLDFSI